MKENGGTKGRRISQAGLPASGKGESAKASGKRTFPFMAFIAACFCTAFFANAALAGEWKQDGGGWWYQNEDSSYPKSAWVWIDGNSDGIYECYAFDANGYLYTNTVTPDNYAVDAGGAWMDHGITVSRAFLGEAGGSTPIGTFAAASANPVFSNGSSGNSNSSGGNSASAQKSNANPSSISVTRAGSGTGTAETNGTATASRSVSAGSSEDTENTSSQDASNSSSSSNSNNSGNSSKNSSGASSSDSGEIQVQRTDGILHSGTNEESKDEEDSGGSSSKKKTSSSNTAEQMDPTATSGTATEAGGPSGNMQSSNSFGTPTADKSTASAPGEGKGRVYWLNGSSTYHSKRDCSALHGSSSNIYSGTLAEAIRNEASEPCSVCN